MRWWPSGWWPRRVDHDAEEAVVEADRKLAEVEERDPEIRRVVKRLEEQRRRNQFGPMIEEAFRRRR
jgi:hypothetical protein